MRGLGLKTGIILCAVLLALALGTSAALAYFSDYEPAQGQVTLNLQGETTIEEGTDPQKKEIVIRNTGGENDAAVVVRVAIFGPDEYLQVSVPDAWVDGGDGWYYYKGILNPGEDTGTAIVAKIANKDGKDLTREQIAALGDSFQVTVVHESEIATYKQEDGRNVLVSPDGWNLPVDQIKVD